MMTIRPVRERALAGFEKMMRTSAKMQAVIDSEKASEAAKRAASETQERAIELAMQYDLWIDRS